MNNAFLPTFESIPLINPIPIISPHFLSHVFSRTYFPDVRGGISGFGGVPSQRAAQPVRNDAPRDWGVGRRLNE